MEEDRYNIQDQERTEPSRTTPNRAIRAAINKCTIAHCHLNTIIKILQRCVSALLYLGGDFTLFGRSVITIYLDREIMFHRVQYGTGTGTQEGF